MSVTFSAKTLFALASMPEVDVIWRHASRSHVNSPHAMPHDCWKKISEGDFHNFNDLISLFMQIWCHCFRFFGGAHVYIDICQHDNKSKKMTTKAKKSTDTIADPATLSSKGQFLSIFYFNCKYVFVAFRRNSEVWKRFVNKSNIIINKTWRYIHTCRVNIGRGN